MRRRNAVRLEAAALALFLGSLAAKPDELGVGEALVLGTFDASSHIYSFGIPDHEL